MAYRFKLNETFEEGSRRIAREQLERARRQLKKSADQAVAVHETRKALKRVRALVRLVRPAIGETVYEAENADLRDIAWILSTVRDRHVLAETLTKLRSVSSIGSSSASELLHGIFNDANGAEIATIEPAAKKEALERLAVAKHRFADFKVDGDGFDAIGPGLETSYRKGRRAFKQAYATWTDDAFHEWRKGVQHHWRHMLLVSSAWPQFCAAQASEARELSKVLGDDHDLAMLAAFVSSEPAERINAKQSALVEKLVRRRQQELRARAYPAGMRLFALGAKELRAMMALYWEAACGPKLPERSEDELQSDGKVQLREKSQTPKSLPKPSRSTRNGNGEQRSRRVVRS